MNPQMDKREEGQNSVPGKFEPDLRFIWWQFWFKIELNKHVKN